jgi:hypothetical protein
MSTRCYLVDENLGPAIANHLRRLQPKVSVLKIGDEGAPPIGSLDPDILLWLEQTGFTLVTRNRKSMPQHLQAHIVAGHHVQGIFTLRPQCSLRDAVEDLLLIWEVAEPEEYQDQIVYIPL